MKKLFTLIVALVATLSVNAETIGNTDNTSGWWTAFSDVYTVKKGEKAVVTFVNHNPGTGSNWYYNWLLVGLNPGAEGPKTLGAAYTPDNELGALRADNFGWGKYFDKPGEDPAGWAASYENTYDWTDLPGLLNGAEVEATIYQDDAGKLNVNVLTKKNGNTYTYDVVTKEALTTEGFSFFFSVDNAHLTDFTVSIEKQAVASAHTYDFTAWSAETVAALKAELNSAAPLWTDIEKESWDAPAELAAGNCFWNYGGKEYADEELTANGVVIAETKGLKFGGMSKRGQLAIAVNYGGHVGTNFGPYNGPCYLWLGNKVDYFLIPDVPAGSSITIGVESHKNGAAEGEDSDPRGIQLSIDGTNLGEAFTPTLYAENTWTVPAGTGNVTVKVQATSGCHLYFIDIKSGSSVKAAQAAPAKVQPKKVLTKDGIIIGGKYNIGGALVK